MPWWRPGHRRNASPPSGPAVSGRHYEVPADMAADVEQSLPGSRTTTSAGTPGLDLRAGIARQLSGLGVRAIDIDPRCTVEDPDLFSYRREPARPTGVGDLARLMTRAEELSAALCSVRERVRRAAETAGRDPGEIQLLPVTKFFPASDVEELYRLGCREFGNPATRKRRPRWLCWIRPGTPISAGTW